jgi:thiol peroxidase
MNQERQGAVTFKGNPMTLVGQPVKSGAAAPDFRVVDNALQPVTLASSAGKIRLITTVPSLDTPVCDTMTRTFNQDAANLPDNVVVYTVSLDLPFAQKRWCGNAGIDRVQTLSLVIDAKDRISYLQLVPEVTSEPDYTAALAAVRVLL